MKTLRKINKSLEFFRKASMMQFLSKVECLQCPDCNFSIERLHHRFFPQYVSKSSCLKKNILRKKSMMENVLIKLRPAISQYKARNFIKKELNRDHVRPFCRSAENSNVFFEKTSSTGASFQ